MKEDSLKRIYLMDKDLKNMKRIDLHNPIGTNLKQENFLKNFLEIEWL